MQEESLKEAIERTELVARCFVCGEKTAPDANKCALCDCNGSTGQETGSDRPDKSASQTELPNFIEPYEVLEFVGQGGMGRVYKVKHKDTGAIFAVKVLLDDLAKDKESVKRFLQEASSNSKLNHPNIATIYEASTTADGQPFLLMDFAEGVNLSRCMESGKLSERAITKIFREIAETLKYAHEQGIVHRDLKPSNIIITGDTNFENPTVKLVDFGLAKVMPSRSGARDTQDLTSTGDIFGTPNYMSPEQCMGFKSDHRTDIYSLGCLIYEATTGTPPFKADNPIQIVIKQLNDRPPRWTSTKLLEGLEAIVFKCLEKDPYARYQSAAEILKDLDQHIAGKKVRMLPTGQAPKAILSGSQAATLVGESIALSVYWVLVSLIITIKSSGLSVALLPVSLFFLLRHLRKYGLGGSNWKQWRLLSIICYVALALTGIPVFIGQFSICDSFPGYFSYVVAISFALHLSMICICLGINIGAFFFSRPQTLNFPKVFRQAAISAAVLLSAVTVNSGGIGIILPNLAGTLTGGIFANGQRHLIPLSLVAKAINPRCANAYEHLAKEYIREKQPQKALSYLNDGIKLNLDYHHNQLLLLRSETLLQEGQLEPALADAAKVLSLEENETYKSNSSLAEAHKQIGDVKLAMKDFSSARSHYEKVSELDPTIFESEFYENRAIARLKTGDKQGALEDIKYVTGTLEQAFYRPEEFIELAIIYEHCGQKDLARKIYQQVISMKASKEVESPAIRRMSFPLAADFVERPSAVAPTHQAKAFAFRRLGETTKAEEEQRQAATANEPKSSRLELFDRLGLVQVKPLNE
ncbi:MAG: protein kinase [Candidatus Obscuribacterales bacterium]|nr:protein kinase [Candidatus Obscuribacterales bacterium]